MPLVISEEDKVRARHHMGYVNVSSVQTYVGGIPAALQTQFMIEGSFDRILNQPGAVAKFHQFLDRMDAIENQVFCGSDLTEVEKLDTIEVNRTRIKELAETYLIAQQGLANMLGIVPNPFDQRDWLKRGQGGINVPVTS